LLTMLKLMHLTAFWPPDKDCVLKKLGKKTLDDIAKIEEKRETILLLDSLDEDPTAYGRVRERLSDILQATQPFFRVIITCRTQFFPDSEHDPFKRPGLAVVAGFRCPVKYLSFFDNKLVTKYLSKRFPKKFGLFPDKKRIEKAQKVIEKMGSLRCRPMLLSFIEVLMESPFLAKEDSEYQVYEALIESWLDREKTKQPDISKKNLSDASIILATYLQMKGLREISEENLDKLIHQISKLRPVKEIELKGRSLLNRNSDGNYRFSHCSIQEFLVAKLLLSDKPVFSPKNPIYLTDSIFRMILCSKEVPNFIKLLDFRGLKLSNEELKGAKLPRAVLKGLDFSSSDLSGADLSDTDLSQTNMRKAILKNVNFTRAILTKTQLEDADLAGAYKANTIGMKFAYIPAGKFKMGSPKEEQRRFDNEILHEVTLTKPFLIQTTPVTQEQWKTVMGNNPSYFKKNKGCGEDSPLENVSYDDAQKFIARLNQKEGTDIYRLPTEAEWEYACRARANTAYCFGDDESRLKEYAWYDENSSRKTHPVAQFKPNVWGVYDMHGNVWEWCQDWYGGYPTNPISDPVGPITGSLRVLRGGSWHDDANRCRSAYRLVCTATDRNSYYGFRLASSIDESGFI